MKEPRMALQALFFRPGPGSDLAQASVAIHHSRGQLSGFYLFLFFYYNFELLSSFTAGRQSVPLGFRVCLVTILVTGHGSSFRASIIYGEMSEETLQSRSTSFDNVLRHYTRGPATSSGHGNLHDGSGNRAVCSGGLVRTTWTNRTQSCSGMVISFSKVTRLELGIHG